MSLIFWEKRRKFTKNILPLLTKHPSQLSMFNCNWIPMSLLTQFDSTVFAHTASLDVIEIFAPMQANSEGHYCEIRLQKTGSHKRTSDFFHKNVSYLSSTLCSLENCFVKIAIAINSSAILQNSLVLTLFVNNSKCYLYKCKCSPPPRFHLPQYSFSLKNFFRIMLN